MHCAKVHVEFRLASDNLWHLKSRSADALAHIFLGVFISERPLEFEGCPAPGHLARDGLTLVSNNTHIEKLSH